MNENIKHKLIKETSELYETALFMLNHKAWTGYERYISKFNKLLREAYQFELGGEILPIKPIPQLEKGSLNKPSASEKEKLSEIVIQSKHLLDNLKSECDKPIPLKNDQNKEPNISNSNINIKWIVFVILLLISSIFLWTYHFFIHWPYLETHNNKFLIKLIAQLLLLFTFLNIPLNKHWRIWIPIIIMIALSIFSIIQF